MRNFYACALLATVLFTACKKDDDIDPVVPYQPIPVQSEMGNLQNGSFVTSDKDNIYFYHFDQSGVKLYAKNRTTAQKTVLDAITTPTVEGGEMLFANLYVNNGYLYYSPFDINGGRRNEIWRAKTDGSAKEEVISVQASQIMYHDNKIYYQSDGLFSVNMDGSGSVKLLDEAGRIAINDNKLYYQTYKYEFNELTTSLHRCDLDGSSSKQLAQFKGSMVFTFGNDKIYAMTGPGNTYSLVEMNTDGSNQKEVLTSLPYATFATFGNTLFLAIPEGNSRYRAGIYKYQSGYKMLMPVLQEPCMYFFFIGNNQIAYGNQNDKVERFPQYYLTDFTGSEGVKLFN